MVLKKFYDGKNHFHDVYYAHHDYYDHHDYYND